jgi:predicted DNA-binding antitoxin AbrB/MazE fold protein
MNLNDLAKTITLKEGKKVSLPISQVKEVLRLVLKELAAKDPADVEATLKRYRR